MITTYSTERQHVIVMQTLATAYTYKRKDKCGGQFSHQPPGSLTCELQGDLQGT